MGGVGRFGPLKERPFRLLWLAWTGSSIGDTLMIPVARAFAVIEIHRVRGRGLVLRRGCGELPVQRRVRDRNARARAHAGRPPALLERHRRRLGEVRRHRWLTAGFLGFALGNVGIGIYLVLGPFVTIEHLGGSSRGA